MRKINLKKNKKGAITDIIMWVIISIVFVIFMALLYYAFGTKVFPALKEGFKSFQNVNGKNVTNMTNYVMDSAIKGMTDSFGWITFGVLFVMAINILLGCFLVRIHPAVAFTIYILVGLAAFVVSVPVSNGYETIINSGSEFASVLSTEFKGASFIMLHLPIWVTVIFFTGLILLLAGIPKDEGAGGGITA